jgi:hypothetical protein
MQPAALGLRAKTGRAIAVILAGDAKKPVFVWRGEVRLHDPSRPETGQPYHEVMELPWKDAIVAVRGFKAAIEAIANSNVERLIEEMRSQKMRIKAMGVVGSQPRSLEKIGNDHIRAHAAEGLLFRRVLEVAAKKRRLPCIAMSEDEAKDHASRVKAMLTALGKVAGPPWRADEQLAATAAWMALA